MAKSKKRVVNVVRVFDLRVENHFLSDGSFELIGGNDKTLVKLHLNRPHVWTLARLLWGVLRREREWLEGKERAMRGE